MATLAHNQAHVRSAQRRGIRVARWIAPLIVMAHVVLALVWGVTVPIGEGPDEPGHFDYALFLAREARLPVQQANPRASDVPGEGHQPPLAYWLMQRAVGWLPSTDRVLEMGANPNFIYSGGAELNAFFRSSRDTWPYTGIARAWHLARSISALLGGITVGLTYLLARRCFPDRRWLARGAAALLALNPQFIFSHALVSNDPLLITLTSGLIYISATIVTGEAGQWTDRRRVGWVLGAGVVLGLMLITKQSALAFVPLPLLAVTIRPRGIVRWLLDVSLIVVVALLLSGWWYLRNERIYGDWLGLAAFQETFAPGGSLELAWSGWVNGLWNLLRSSWGNFGWLTLPLNNGAHWAFAAFLALGAIGLFASVGQCWWQNRTAVGLVLAGVIMMAFGWTVAFARIAGAVAWQGRFLFPAASAIALLLACGLGIVLPGRSALVTLLSLSLVLAVALPRSLIAPAYPSYVLPPQPANSGNVYGRFDVGWKRGVELRNVELPSEATVGDTIPITLTWHALEQMDRPWTVFIHLADANENILDDHDAQPLNGAFPMTSWVAGDWVRDPQALLVAHAPPGTYRVWIGLWDANTGARLGVYDRDGKLVNDRVEVGPITIRSRQ